MNIFLYEMKNFHMKWNISYMKLNYHIWKALKGFSFEWNYAQLKFKPGTVEKNESTIGPTGPFPKYVTLF